MGKKLLFNNVVEDESFQPPTEGTHYHQSYTSYPIEVEDNKLCTEHKSYITEIIGNTENGQMVGEEQADGTYKITLIISGGE